jgi:hypothetical protein
MTRENQPLETQIRPPALTLAEAISRHFHDWEERGRGWQLWTHAADLEPPFRPFFHFPPLGWGQIEMQDDGRVPTFFSRIVDGLGGLLRGRAASAPSAMLDDEDAFETDEPAAGIFVNERPLAEIEIALPPALRVAKDLASQLLISLTYCHLPLSIEIVGTSEAIVSCRSSAAMLTSIPCASSSPPASRRPS